MHFFVVDWKVHGCELNLFSIGWVLDSRREVFYSFLLLSLFGAPCMHPMYYIVPLYASPLLFVLAFWHLLYGGMLLGQP